MGAFPFQGKFWENKTNKKQYGGINMAVINGSMRMNKSNFSLPQMTDSDNRIQISNAALTHNTKK